MEKETDGRLGMKDEGWIQLRGMEPDKWPGYVR
jgi:hypothetical protein